jgi:hypothetical protein
VIKAYRVLPPSPDDDSSDDEDEGDDALTDLLLDSEASGAQPSSSGVSPAFHLHHPLQLGLLSVNVRVGYCKHHPLQADAKRHYPDGFAQERR